MALVYTDFEPKIYNRIPRLKLNQTSNLVCFTVIDHREMLYLLPANTINTIDSVNL